jgi:hypothetical protein
VAGLRGATGLRVLQKWMLDSRGLGVSSRVGVWGRVTVRHFINNTHKPNSVTHSLVPLGL